MADPIAVYLETGQKRTFAAALAWPGWCRGGRDEASALQALADYGSRYAAALGPSASSLGFVPPDTASAFTVIERLAGGSGTDFGAPGAIPARDSTPVDAGELDRLREVLERCWNTLDRAVRVAAGKELSKGPRGGGRDLDDILRHALEAQAGYLSRISWKLKVEELGDVVVAEAITRQAVFDALAAAVRGEMPATGPRGGARWPPRYFVRRSAWHILDHAWEIEDRTEG